MTCLPLRIDPDHPAFAGHFPSMPIVPGVVLLDEGLRAIARHREETTGHADLEHCRLSAAKFLSFVRPGEAVRLEIEASPLQAASRAPDAPIDAPSAARTLAAFRIRIFAGPAEHERLAVSGSVAFERAVAASPASVSTG